ncbi:MAG TPA: carbamoyl-phosphate synthase small subunit [Chloroflexi bacterium]|nr:carbamoyl-phosphate synthase small subunit [Chloroflexota bacterium]
MKSKNGPTANKEETPGTALLALEDGTSFWGKSVGARGETFGELVFNTGMAGYQEVLTDPSYRGQIVVMTYPEVGIYGVNPEDVESQRIQVAGFVVHRAVKGAFNHQATLSFVEYLEQAGIVALEGVDTRALTRHIRTQGAMRGAISTVDLVPESLIARVRRSPSIVGRDLVREVSPREPVIRSTQTDAHLHVVVIDAGAKGGIIRELALRGVDISLVPYDADVKTVLSLHPDGVLVSNGPGDPAALRRTIVLIQEVLERRIPLAGICLGHQLLALALGGQTYKMRFGHRGINHPVKDLTTDRVLITTHNHGFAVDPTSLGIHWKPLDTAFRPSHPHVLGESNLQDITLTMADRLPSQPLVGESPLGFGPVEITHLSLNDGTVEGLRLRDFPALSVQFHPEASPGPHDARGFFDHFWEMMR